MAHLFQRRLCVKLVVIECVWTRPLYLKWGNCFRFVPRDIDILHKCGRDAVQYLSFQRYLLVYVSIITVISIAVILPINFQGNLCEYRADEVFGVMNQVMAI